MKGQAVLVLVTVGIAIFSGCIGDAGGTSTQSSTSPTATGSSPGATATTAAPGDPGTPNQPPVAHLQVFVDENETVVVNGTATVNATTNVTFSAAGSTDPEGTTLTFSWTVDGNASVGSDAAILQSFEVGNHTVMVKISDGELEAETSLSVVALAAELEGAVAGGGAVAYAFTGSIAAGTAGAAVAAKVPKTFEVPEGALGLTAALSWSHSGVGTPFLADLDIRIFDAKGTNQGQALTTFTNHEYVRITDPAKLAKFGSWKAEIDAYSAPAGAAYRLDIVVWVGAPTATVFSGTVQGTSSEAGAAAYKHTVDVPADAHAVSARLTWTTQGQSAGRNVNDFDIVVKRGAATMCSSASFGANEFCVKYSGAEETLGPAAQWTVEVAPYMVANAVYTLTVEYA